MTLKIKFLFALLLLWGTAGAARPEADKIQVSEDIELIRLSPKAYVHVSVAEMEGFGKVSCNGLILLGGGEAFLFDTPATGAQTATLAGFIADSLHARIVGFVPNHWHADCMGGLAYLHEKGVASYANRMTVAIAREKGLPVPEHGFTDSLALELNGIGIGCYYFGGGHTADNIVVWIPSEKILFAGCMVKDMSSAGPGNLSDARIDQWPVTIGKVIARFPSAEIVIPGHGPLGGKELLTHTLKLLDAYK